MAKGFVYILRNEAMPGLLKIGYTVKVPTVRVNELFSTGVPEPFELAYYCLVENADKLEPEIHRNLAIYRHRENREFFRVELEAVVRSIAGLCTPEHEWFAQKHQTITDTPLLAGNCDTSLYGVTITSRDSNDDEMKEMVRFVELAHQRSLTSYVRSLFYDSNSCCCYFELADDVVQYGPISNQLREIALETVRQFEWFGLIEHGGERDESDEF